MNMDYEPYQINDQAEPPIRRPRPRQDQEALVRKNLPDNQMSRKHTILTKYYEPARGSIKEDAKSGHRIYRLKGYTTVDKINRKFQQERNQRTLRHLLTLLMIIILLVVIFAIYNPFTNMEELKKISGENSLFRKSQSSQTTEPLIEFP